MFTPIFSCTAVQYAAMTRVNAREGARCTVGPSGVASKQQQQHETYTALLPSRKLAPGAHVSLILSSRLAQPPSRAQGGTAFADVLSTVLVEEDGSVIVAGYTSGSWIEGNAGEEDYLVVKLDSDGNEIWVWQVRDGQKQS